MNDIAAFEADVVLADGQIVLLRPLTADDRTDLISFYARVSPESKYLRFLAAHPSLSEEELDAWTTVTKDALTLGLWEHGQLIATARYDLVPGGSDTGGERVAEVSFLVEDAAQGRGAANLLLEHLAEAGREASISRFWAETLPENKAMLQVFVRAGYFMVPELEDGLVVVEFSVEPTQKSRLVMEQRERRSEATAIRHLLHPGTIALLGSNAALGHVVSSVMSSGYTGRVRVETASDTAESIANALESMVGDIDLVVIPFINGDLDAILKAASDLGARGLLMYSGGKDISPGVRQARHFVATARRHGMRALGPASLGIINTNPDVLLNLSPARMPEAGPVSMFTQSAGIAAVSLTSAIRQAVPLNHFVSTGTYADLTANDMMQFWEDDELTRVCILSIDSVGNPRKFFRLLRRLSQRKIVLVFLPSRALTSARYHRSESVELPSAPATAMDTVIRQAGAIVVDRRENLISIGRILAVQPMPRGKRVRILSNSTDLTYQMKQAAIRFGLEPSVPRRQTISESSIYDELASSLQEAIADEDVDSIVVTIVDMGNNSMPRTQEVLREFAEGSSKTIVGSLVAFDQSEVAEQTGQLPLFDNYAAGLEALGLLANRFELREEDPADPADAVLGPEEEDLGLEAGEIVQQALADNSGIVELSPEKTRRLLSSYGIEIMPTRPVSSFAEAQQAAEEMGWDVILKKDHPVFRGRPDIVPIAKHISDIDELTSAWRTISEAAPDLGDAADILVQPTAEAGPSLTFRGIEDAALGPMISVGVSGIPSQLLGDLTWTVPTGSALDALAALENLKAAPVLSGFNGSPPANVDELVDILLRLGQLKSDIPSVIDIELMPVLAGQTKAWVGDARVRLSALPSERDPLMRYL